MGATEVALIVAYVLMAWGIWLIAYGRQEDEKALSGNPGQGTEPGRYEE